LIWNKRANLNGSSRKCVFFASEQLGPNEVSETGKGLPPGCRFANHAGQDRGFQATGIGRWSKKLLDSLFFQT
jgi:hypothetical protein